MKKVIIILSILISLFIIYKISDKETIPVNMKLSSFSMEDYNVFYLDLEDTSITTKNLVKYFKNVDIITIEPYINPIYKDKLDLKYDFVNNMSIKKNINNFINYYKETIKNRGFMDDLNYIDIDGIKIEKIKVYGRGIDIYKIIYDNNIRYKTVVNGIYKYLEV